MESHWVQQGHSWPSSTDYFDTQIEGTGEFLSNDVTSYSTKVSLRVVLIANPRLRPIPDTREKVAYSDAELGAHSNMEKALRQELTV